MGPAARPVSMARQITMQINSKLKFNRAAI